MPPATAQDLRPQLDAHEERLQRVESNSEETRVKVAEIATKIDHYEEMQAQSRTDLAQKIESGFETLSEGQKALLAKLETHSQKLLDHQQAIDTAANAVKAIEERRAKRTDFLKKVGIVILFAGLGVLGTKLAETIILRLGLH